MMANITENIFHICNSNDSELVPIVDDAVNNHDIIYTNNNNLGIICVIEQHNDETAVAEQEMSEYEITATLSNEVEEIRSLTSETVSENSKLTAITVADNEESIGAVLVGINSLDKDEIVRNEAVDPKQIKRKRIRNEQAWKCNERKRKCQAGEAYLNKRNKRVPRKRVINKKDCLNSCKFKCSAQIPMKLLASYCKLNQNEKHLYLLQVTNKIRKRRSTKKNLDDDEDSSRRQYTFIYNFPVDGKLVRVCKQFFLGTLCISQKPIYNAHATKDANQVPRKDGRGKSLTSSRRIPQKLVDDVITHIRLFPTIESHYCRSRTKRQYIEATSSIPKMYDLYLIWSKESNKQQVKMSMYRRIFVTNFNYGFHIPKTDRCVRCETYKIKKAEGSLTNEEETTHQTHIAEKTAMRAQKNKDKEDGYPMLIFDLENVITCPRTEIGNFFYLPKLNMYNLTAYLTTTKTVYCAIWSEVQQGRSGNCLASAFKKILDRVLLDNEIGSHLITWSDSCVAQNRNSYIAFSVLETLRQNKDLQTSIMNYSSAGHGAVQEVDSVHSRIESFMKKAEFFSPLGFIRNLKSINKKHPYVIIQMKDTDFKNYEECAARLNYKAVPFSKVVSLKFTQELNIVQYKTSHCQVDFQLAIISIFPENKRRESARVRGGGTSRVRTRGGRRNINSSTVEVTPALQIVPRVLQEKREISKEKLAAIKKMMASIPEIDKLYYRALLKIN